MTSERSVLGFGVPLREVRRRLDVHYSFEGEYVDRRYSSPRYPTVPLGELITLIQYGSSQRASSDPAEGIPILRINNLQDDGWDLNDLKYVALSPDDLVRYQLQPGDIVFTRTNGSRELVGKCEVFRESGTWVFASYLIRLRINSARALPEFVSAFLNTTAGRRQVERLSRQILMSNINTQEIRSLLIPLPPLNIQQSLVQAWQQARKLYEERLAGADALVAGIDEYVSGELALSTLAYDLPLTFSVSLSGLRNRRIDAPAYQASSVSVPSVRLARLEDVAAIDLRPKDIPKPGLDDVVPYVGLPECSLTEIREVARRPYESVRSRSVATPNDILFARIEPSVFNKKYVFAGDLKGFDFVWTSTEFNIIRGCREIVLQEFLYALLFTSFVHEQVRGKTTGSSGRRRIDREALAGIQVPLPSLEKQREISDELSRRRQDAASLRSQAIEEWNASKLNFESDLLRSPDELGLSAKS